MSSRHSSGFGYAFSPSHVEGGDAASAGNFSKRTSAFMLKADRRKSPLAVSTAPLGTKNKKDNVPKSAFARLSYHVSSPLFGGGGDPALSSLTFSVSFSATHSGPKSASPPPPLNYSATSVSDSSVYSLATAADERPFFSRAASMPQSLSTSKSLGADGNEMIDQQLEMLSQLFPKETKTYSGQVEAQSVSVPAVHVRESAEVDLGEDDDEYDITSDYQDNDIDEPFQKQEKSRISQLLSDWPKMDELIDEDDSEGSDAASALAKLENHPSMSDKSVPSVYPDSSPDSREVLGQPSKLAGVSSFSDPSPGSSLASRRSLNPHLSVDPAKTQKFAVRELEMIRKMKDSGAIRHANSEPVKVVAAPVVEAISDKPIPAPASHIPPAVQVIYNDAAHQPSITKPLPPPPAGKSKPGHAKKKSTDSSVSGIVWSAVVERFSEMAQEIAGKVSPKNAERRSQIAIASTAHSDASGRLSVQSASTVRPKKTSFVVESPTNEEEGEAFELGSSLPESEQTDLPSSISPEDDLASLSINSDLPGFKAVEDGSTVSSHSASPPHLDSLIVLKRRSNTGLHSILKRMGSSDESSETLSSDTGGNGKTRAWARKPRLRTVRVQSHHAKVEGDYAAFLKRASRIGDAADAEDGEVDEKRSVKSFNSRHSGKSGIENGCFRRGSMSSIKTGKTIASIGTVKDMSRGARFRHPSPFFATGRGLIKPPHGPHQKGNPGLHLQKASKAKRASLEIKRGSTDGETLGAALARLKVEKRNAPGPSIGELSFENDDPSKPITRKATIRDKGKGRAVPNGPLPPKPAGYAASAFTPSSSRGPGSAQLPSRPGYSASAVTPSYNPRARHGPSSSVGALTHANLHQMPFQQMPNGMPGYSASAVNPSYSRAPGSALSAISASRQIVTAQSNLSVSSKRGPQSSGPRSAGPGPGMRAHQRSLSASQGMHQNTALGDSFISMTPARSDMSAISARSDKDLEMMSGGITSLGSAGKHFPFPPAAGPSMAMPGFGGKISRSPPQTISRHQRQASAGSGVGRSPANNGPPQSGSGSRGLPARSNTDPLPPLPNSLPALPLRTLSNGGHVDPRSMVENRMSATHRPHAPLSINTDAAQTHASRALKLKQMPVDDSRRRISTASAAANSQANARHNSINSNNRFTIQSRQNQQGIPESPEAISAATSRPPDTAFTSRMPKSASAAFANVASVFVAAAAASGGIGPKRPARTDSGLPERLPRPPSAEPIDDFLQNELMRDPDAKSIGGGGGAKKSVKKMFGFGKKK